jgi:hypothetical protein
MNIFFLDWDTKKCAEYHCDKHVVKMILETAQLLCTVHHVSDTQIEIPYRIVHKNHPCSIWSRTSLSNYLYLSELGLELGNEYTFRYGKKHKSSEIIEWSILNKPNIPDIGFTSPPLAMPEQYKETDPIQSYRNYYMGEKLKFANWKNRDIPHWLSKKYHEFR